jgi:hypothetical protein
MCKRVQAHDDSVSCYHRFAVSANADSIKAGQSVDLLFERASQEMR